MKKIIHWEYYVCDYCGREFDNHKAMLAYDEDLNGSRVIDICSNDCLEKHEEAVKERWDNDLNFRNWYKCLRNNSEYSLERYLSENIKYNK